MLGSYAVQQASDALARQQQSQAFSGQMEEQAAVFIEQILNAVAEKVMTVIDETPEGHDLLGVLSQRLNGGRPTRSGSVPSSARRGVVIQPGSGSGSQQTQPTETQTPTHSSEEAKAPPLGTSQILGQYRQARSAEQDMTMRGVAGQAMRGVAHYVSERNPGYVQATNDDGTRVLRKMGADGSVIDEVAEGEAGFNSIRRKSYLVGQATRVAAGEGLSLGSIAPVLGRVAGPVGMVVGAASVVGNALESQNRAAATYRSYYGEEAGGPFAAQSRFSEYMAGLRGFGTIGGEQARENFRLAASMGLRGADRSEATGFMGDMFMRYGMKGEESQQIVANALATGVSSLDEFADAIKEVSKAAVEGGRSSKEAIEGFVAAQKYVGTNLVGGTASVQIAKNAADIADHQISRGLSESIGGAPGIVGMVNDRNIAMVAMASGQDVSTAMWRATDPSTAAQQAAATVTGVGNLLVRNVAGTMGRSEEQVRAAVKQMTGGKTPSNEREMARVFEELCGGAQQAGMVFRGMQLYAGNVLRIPTDRGHLLRLFFESLAGAFESEGQQQKDVTGGGLRTYEQFKVDPKTGVIAAGEDRDAWREQAEKISDRLGGASTTSGASGAYFQSAMTTGKGSSVAEALLNPDNQKKVLQAAGAGIMEQVKIRVQDGTSTKDLSVEEIMRDPKYYQQLASGKASILGGKDGPTSVADVLGLAGQGKDYGTSSGKAPTGELEEQRVKLVIDHKGKVKFDTSEGPSDETYLNIPAPSWLNPSNYFNAGGG
jgi:hypothetical protein